MKPFLRTQLFILCFFLFGVTHSFSAIVFNSGNPFLIVPGLTNTSESYVALPGPASSVTADQVPDIVGTSFDGFPIIFKSCT